MYKIQRTLPNRGNKYYNTKSNGGYSECIQGYPTVDGLNVLDNCVGWACGRFNEIYSIETDFEGMKYAKLHCNAEYFIDQAKSLGLQTQKEPCDGGIMVWQGKGDLAGHVAVVEQVIDGNTVLTSESGYNHFDFKNEVRKNDNGRWGTNSNYPYLGCIINPANPKPDIEPSGGYPFEGLVKKGSPLYNEQGQKYANGASADRDVTVEGELNGRYQVWGSTFNPHTVYVDKGNVVKKGDKYPFNAIIKKGSNLYDKYGNKYKNGTSADRDVIVQGEYNGRYEIYGETFNPHVVYCDKSSIK